MHCSARTRQHKLTIMLLCIDALHDKQNLDDFIDEDKVYYTLDTLRECARLAMVKL
jgi:hypothetical protein